MNARHRFFRQVPDMVLSCVLALTCLAWMHSAAAEGADVAVSGQVNGVEIGTKSQPATSAMDKSSSAPAANKSCHNQCDSAESRCSSEVRRARQECSRNAANGGRDPFAAHNADLAYFCSYFRSSWPCGSGGDCRARFAQHYNQCLGLMQENIASMRYDCFRSERDAQNICRNELRACRTACQ